MESAKLIAGLTRIVQDVGLAEDLAQDALLAALERWPETGIPDKPGAWLMATAKHRAIDHLRRGKMLDRKHVEVGHELELRQEAAAGEIDAAIAAAGWSHDGRDRSSISRVGSHDCATDRAGQAHAG
jgi:RNA polymerase sigma-70 factor (ECF subfamily)